ncbi:MAG: bacillithiol biosynthesis deacetylase BshB1, partial [Balneolales bacterium]
ARLTADALFYSGLKNIKTEGQEPWRPFHMLHYMQHWSFVPSLIFDITDTLEIKEQAILEFKSQFNVPASASGPKTYISGKPFFDALRGRARYYGHKIGVEFGEPFLYYGGPMPVKNLDFLMESKTMS